MAGHENRDRVLAAGHSHGARTLRRTDLAGDFAVGLRRAKWDALHCTPDPALERRARAQIERERKLPPSSSEVRSKLGAEFADRRVGIFGPVRSAHGGASHMG